MTEETACQYILFSLREIADNLANNRLRLPAVQRGSVWDAGKVLALWDSLLRGFPIGTFSIKTMRGSDGVTVFDLLDGQQRATAIAMGFAYPPKNDASPILWVDLGNRGKTEVQLFVTTPAHPWGYHASGKPFEPPQKLSSSQQRAAVQGLEGWSSSTEESLLVYRKPKARELYPVEAVAPVPMALALEAWKRCATVGELKAYCEAHGGTAAKWLHRGALSEEAWQRFKGRIEACGLEQRVIFGMCADNVRPEEYGDYFERIGRGGVVPSVEEIEYSKLKAELEVKEPGAGAALRETMEALAKGFTSPSRLAHIALNIYDRQTDAPRKSFFREGFRVRFERCKAMLLAKGLLPWHISQLCDWEEGAVMAYLLSQKEVTLEHIGVAMLLLSYCQSGCLRKVLKELKAKGLKHGLKVAFCERYYNAPWVRVPLLKDALEALTAEDIPNGYCDAGMMSILLSGCHDFIDTYFKDYTAYAAQWEEDDCPWDYDHIIPSSWFDKAEREWRLKEVDKELFQLKDCIGNRAPLPYSLNRSKSDGAPGKTYPLQGELPGDEVARIKAQLCLEPYESVLEAAKDATCLEDEAFRKRLKQAIVERFKRLYARWLEQFRIDALLDYSKELANFPKYNLLTDVKAALGDADFKFYYSQGAHEHAFDPTRPIEWFTHWWHTLGCVVGRTSVCLSTDGFTWQLGLAKLPNEATTNQEVASSLGMRPDGYWYSLERGDLNTEVLAELVATLSKKLKDLKAQRRAAQTAQ